MVSGETGVVASGVSSWYVVVVTCSWLVRLASGSSVLGETSKCDWMSVEFSMCVLAVVCKVSPAMGCKVNKAVLSVEV